MIVADTSPIIALARIGQLDLLPALHGQVAIPRAVDEEITRHPHGFGGARPDWIRVHDARPESSVAALRRKLGRGEAEAIVLAIGLGSRLLIDERTGRQVAAAHGVEVVGTLGALLDARRRGFLPRLEPALLQLRGAGFRMTDALMAELRRVAGEE